MRNILTAAIVTGTLLTLPAIGLASPAATAAPTHATKGIVTSVTPTKLSVERSPRYGGIMTFLMNPSTERDGNVKVGSTVQVRYRTAAHQRIATVVKAEPATAAPSAPGSHQ